LSDDDATLDARTLEPNELSESAEAARVRIRVGLELREERPLATAPPLLACVLEAWLAREAREDVDWPDADCSDELTAAGSWMAAMPRMPPGTHGGTSGAETLATRCASAAAVVSKAQWGTLGAGACNSCLGLLKDEGAFLLPLLLEEEAPLPLPVDAGAEAEVPRLLVFFTVTRKPGAALPSFAAEKRTRV
jgi:hypothetical protein